MKARVLIFAVLVPLVILAVPLTLFAVIVFHPNPLNVWTSKSLPWPAACSTKGCVTTKAWARQNEINQMFTESTNEEPMTTTDALETLLHQHLVEKETSINNVVRADATKYRQEILNLENEEQVQETLGLSLTEYDDLVLVPLLKQEALRQERGLTSPQQLFANLAQHRTIFVLPQSLRWDRATATVVAK